MKQGVGLAILLLVALVTISACGGGGGQQGGGPTPTPAAGGTSISITETEFKFTPASMTAKAGPVTFELKNVGSVEHNFVIEGTEVNREAIQAGTSETITVTLQPGEYTILCTVPGHKEAGMVAKIRVQ